MFFLKSFCEAEIKSGLVLETDLRDGGLADLHSYRLKLWIGGQVQLVVPQQLQE